LKKKILVLVLVVLIAAMAYLYTRPTLPVLSIDKVYNVTNVGDTVLVNVNINNVPSCGYYIVLVIWDPTLLQITTGGPNATLTALPGPPVQVHEGPFLKQSGPTRFIINFVDNQNGEVYVGDAFPGGSYSASGTGIIFTINFTVVKVGTTTIETRPPSTALNQSVVADSTNHAVDHAEAYGLVTNEGPPPIWTSADFQTTTIAGEVVVLGATSALIYQRRHPRPPKSERRKAELQPVIAPEDQRQVG
jgi:hypothetical protein